jgi:hypothetical protein
MIRLWLMICAIISSRWCRCPRLSTLRSNAIDGYPITNRFRDPGTPLPAPDVSLVSGLAVKTEAFDF